MAPPETVTEWHHKRHSPNGITRDSHRMASWEKVETTTKRLFPDYLEWVRGNLDYLEPYLRKAPTGMVTERLTEMDVEWPYWWAVSLLGRFCRRMNISTDGHRVRATRYKGWSQIHQGWLTKLCTRARKSANAPEYMYGVNVQFMRSLWDRYRVIHAWPSPAAMIPIRSYNPCRQVKPASSLLTELEYHLQSSNNDPWWAGPAELFTRNWVSSSASALRSIVSMTCHWDAYNLDIPMQLSMVMAMAMPGREWKPPSVTWSKDDTHTMIGDFTEITGSNSDNDLRFVRVMCARLDGHMPDIPEVEIWRTVSLWMFLLSLFFTSVSFFTSLLHYFFGSRPSTNGVGTGCYHLSG